MSGSDDRGWNIILGKARPERIAKLLGGSRDGETSTLGKLITAACAALIIAGVADIGLIDLGMILP